MLSFILARIVLEIELFTAQADELVGIVARHNAGLPAMTTLLQQSIHSRPDSPISSSHVCCSHVEFYVLSPSSPGSDCNRTYVRLSGRRCLPSRMCGDPSSDVRGASRTQHNYSLDNCIAGYVWREKQGTSCVCASSCIFQHFLNLFIIIVFSAFYTQVCDYRVFVLTYCGRDVEWPGFPC